MCMYCTLQDLYPGLDRGRKSLSAEQREGLFNEDDCMHIIPLHNKKSIKSNEEQVMSPGFGPQTVLNM